MSKKSMQKNKQVLEYHSDLFQSDLLLGSLKSKSLNLAKGQPQEAKVKMGNQRVMFFREERDY